MSRSGRAVFEASCSSRHWVCERQRHQRPTMHGEVSVWFRDRPNENVSRAVSRQCLACRRVDVTTRVVRPVGSAAETDAQRMKRTEIRRAVAAPGQCYRHGKVKVWAGSRRARAPSVAAPYCLLGGAASPRQRLLAYIGGGRSRTFAPSPPVQSQREDRKPGSSSMGSTEMRGDSHPRMEALLRVAPK